MASVDSISSNTVFLEAYSDKPELVPSTIVETLRTDKDVFYQMVLQDEPGTTVGSMVISPKRREVLGLDNLSGDFFEKTRKVGRVGTELLQFAIQRIPDLTLTAVPKSVLFYLNLGFRPIEDRIVQKKYEADIMAFNQIRRKENFSPEQFAKIPARFLKVLAKEKGMKATAIDYDFFMANWWWNESEQPKLIYSLTQRVKDLYAENPKPDFAKIPSIQMHLPPEALRIWRGKISGELTYSEFRDTLRRI